jgi:hypothetical protein
MNPTVTHHDPGKPADGDDTATAVVVALADVLYAPLDPRITLTMQPATRPNVTPTLTD